jgi:hypothetical protein
VILQLDPTIPLETPRGKGFAHFLMDFGQEHYSYFGIFLDDTGQFWWISQKDCTLQYNITMGRPPKENSDAR